MLGGGFAATGAKLKSGVYTRTPGEFKLIKGTGDDIRKALYQYPEIPISNVLFQLLSLIIQYADRLAGTVGPTTGENPGQNTPASTYQGMIEQGTNIYRSIFKRIWRSMKEEFKKLHELNARFLAESQKFGAKGLRVTQEMYKTDPDQVIPVADPNLVSDQQRMAQAGAIAQRGYAVPGYNVEEVERRFLRAMGAQDIDKVYPGAFSKFAQQHPLPNPKLQVEQAKMQGEQLKLQHEKWKTVVDLRSGQQKMQAEIDLLRAQAAQIVSSIGGDKAALQLEAFDKLMNHVTNLAQMMGDKADKLSQQSDQETGGENEDQSSGAGRTQGEPGGQGADAAPAQNAGVAA
jgi:hypothetical protein